MNWIYIFRNTFAGRFFVYVLFSILTAYWYVLVLISPLGLFRVVQTFFVVLHFLACLKYVPSFVDDIYLGDES